MSLPVTTLWLAAMGLSAGWFATSASAAEQKVERFKSGGRMVQIETFPAKNADAPSVLVLHGSTGVEFGNRFIAEIARSFAGQGFNTHLLHYFERTGARYADDATIRTSFPEWLDAINDAVGFIQKIHPRVKIGIFGYSLGGYLAIAHAARDSRISAVVELAGGIDEASAALTKGFPPTLILHADRDTRVPISEGRKLEAALKKRGADVELHVYEGEDHLLQPTSYLDVLKRGAAFFRRHLR